MAETITTGSHSLDLLPAINEWFGADYSQLPIIYSQIFDVSSSDRAFERDAISSGLGLPTQKDETAAVKYDSMVQGFDQLYRHVVFTNGFQISWEAREDSQTNVVAEKQSRELKKSMMQGREIIAAQLLNRAFDSNFVLGDGVELCSTAHPTLAGNFANKAATDADLSEAALEQAIITIADLKDNRGLKMSAAPRKLIVASDGRFEAHRIMHSNLRVSTADNDPNAIKDMGMFPGGIVVNNYMTDPDAWFILTDAAAKDNGLRFIVRSEMFVNSDNDFDNFNAKFISVDRYATGASDTRAIYGSAGA